MDNGICLAYVGQEFVSESLALGGPFHQTGYVHYFHSGRNDALGGTHFHQAVESLVRNGDDAHIGLDSTEREIGRLSLGVAQTVEEGGFAHVGQPYYAAF